MSVTAYLDKYLSDNNGSAVDSGGGSGSGGRRVGADLDVEAVRILKKKLRHTDVRDLIDFVRDAVLLKQFLDSSCVGHMKRHMAGANGGFRGVDGGIARGADEVDLHAAVE